MNAFGFDCSVWQDDNSTPVMMDFHKARREGAEFAFIKASQGAWLDPDYVLNWQHAKDAGIPRGAYHFLDWSRPALAQARFFCGVLSADPGELPPVLDYECRKNAPERTVALQAALTFVNEVQRFLGARPIVYTSPSYWYDYGSIDPFWKQYDLWIANYGVSRPAIPAPWNTWTFWQHTDSGDGLRFGAEFKKLDMNRFNGDSAALIRYIGGTPPPPVPQPLRVRTPRGMVNIRNAPNLSSASDVGDLLATAIDAEDAGDFWKVTGYIAKSVTEAL